MNAIKTVAKRTALIVLVADIYHCYSYMSNYYFEADAEETEEDKQQAEREIITRYRGDCNEDSIVSKQDFELRVQKAQDDMLTAAAKQNDNDVLEYRIHHSSMKINRESVAFLGGGSIHSSRRGFVITATCKTALVGGFTTHSSIFLA